ncbi:MAG: hypothetical protein ACR2GR_02655 [Rhodothermales bacterium]
MSRPRGICHRAPRTSGWWGLVLAVTLLVTGFAVPSQAQTEQFGIGGLTGSPSGLTFKLYFAPDRARALDIIASWTVGRADASSRLYFHSLREQRISNSPLNFIRGPGLVIGSKREGGDNQFLMGISAIFGFNFYVERFEVFLQAMPRLEMDPKLEPRAGGAAGLRYYF